LSIDAASGLMATGGELVDRREATAALASGIARPP